MRYGWYSDFLDNFIYQIYNFFDMVTNLPKKDYIVTKIILAIGLIPFTFYMLQTDILRGGLLDKLIGIDLLSTIFSIMLFFLTIAIFALSLSFTDIINKDDKKACFKIFNWSFDVGVSLSVLFFVLILFTFVAVRVGNAIKEGVTKFINENIIIIIFFVLISISYVLYNKYFKKSSKRKNE